MPQLLQHLYSKVYFRFNQFPDLHTYVQNRVPLPNYNFEGVIVKVAEPSDFELLVETIDKFRDNTRITERTNRGDVCVVVYKNGALAHFRWVALTPIPLKEFGGRVVHLAPDEAFTYDSYTLPAFRRQGLSSEAKIVLMKYLTKQGIRCAYSDGRLDNIHTQQVWRKRLREGRQRIIGMITIVTRFRQKYYTFTAETSETRSLIARLFNLQLEQIQVRSINEFIAS